MSIFFVFALIGLLSFFAAVSYRQEETAKISPISGFDQQIQLSVIAILLILLAYLFGKKRSSPGQRKLRMPRQPGAKILQDGQPSGDVTIIFAKRWAARVLLVSGLLTLTVIAVFWPALRAPDSPETPFQEFLGSRFIGAAAFGWFFGILFGYWFSSVLFRKPEDKPGYKEIAVGIVMAVLLLIGLGGQRIISQSLSRLTTVEFAGAKIGLDPTGIPKSTVPSQTYSPAGNTQTKGPDQSQGLYLIEQLWEGQTDRDQRYVLLLARANGIDTHGLDSDIVASRQGLKEAFGSLISCMTVFYDRTGDDIRIWQLLSPIASGMRRFALSPPAKETLAPPAEWEDAFWSAADSIARELPPKFDDEEGTSEEEATQECLKLPKIGDHARGDYLKVMRDNSWKKNPYYFLVIASMLAYGHEYEQSIVLIHQAIKHISNALPNSSQAASELVYRIRLRGAVVTYMEEWLHGFNSVKLTSNLAEYELNNLTEEIESDLKNRLFESTVKPAARVMQSIDNAFGEPNFGETPRDDSACNKPDDFFKDATSQDQDWLDALFLSRALVSAKLNWITVALDSPVFFDNYQHKANEYIEELRKLNLSCFAILDHNISGHGSSDAVRLKVKDVLEAYARLTYANCVGTEKNRELTSDAAKIDKLQRAEQAVGLALVMIAKIKPESSVPPLLKPLTSDTVDQSKTDLENLRRSIKGAIAELQQ